MHHFTWKKKKLQPPQELGKMLEESILNLSHSTVVEPKKRASRGPRKHFRPITFTFQQLERLVNAARQIGNQELISLLNWELFLKNCKQRLIASIRNYEVCTGLWDAYVQAVQREESRSK